MVRTKIRQEIIPIVLFFAAFTLYFATSSGNTPFNYFVRLADAFLHGRYWVTDNPSWLSELLPGGNGRFYVVYPPMPAILLVPFVAVFGANFPQQILAHALGAGAVVVTYWTSMAINKNVKKSVYVALCVGVGSIVWFMSSVGSSWYLGQVCAFFFLSAALLESVGRKRIWIVGALLGAAYLSRTHTIITLPIYIYLLRTNLFTRHGLVSFVLSLGVFIGFDSLYNFLRFGSLFNQGYFLLPKALDELNAPWFAKGVVNLSYIPHNIQTMFWTFPTILNEVPYIRPSWNGLSIWITSPFFIYVLLAPLKDRIVQLSWLAILSVFIIVASHGGNGFAQFGYRFAVDFYSFAFLLLAISLKRTELTYLHWILLFAAIVVNTWGVIWINFMGWIAF